MSEEKRSDCNDARRRKRNGMQMKRKESGEHTAFLINLLKLLCQSGDSGVSVKEIGSLYCDGKNAWPCDKTITRAIKALNVILDPNAESEEPEWRTPRSSLPIRLQTTEENGVRTRRYVFAQRGLFCEQVGTAPKPTPELALSLYAQKKNLGGQDFMQLLSLLTEGLQEKKANPILADLEKFVYVSGFSPVQSGANLRKILQVFQAIQRRRPVRFQYTSASTGKMTKSREVNPFGLVFRHSVWYMAGLCRESNEQRIFRIDHIDRLSVLENTTYTIPADFSLERYYGQTWGIWTETKKSPNPETIELEVMAAVASHFEATCYHASQRVERLADGRLSVKFHVGGAKEMLPWIIGWGAFIKVLQPAWLREQVVGSARSILSQYELPTT